MPPTVDAENAPANKTERLNAIVAWMIALLGAGVCSFLVSGSLAQFGRVNDLPEYYAAARLFVENRAADIYRLQVFYPYQQELFPMLGTRGIGLFLPPLAVPLLAPLALIPLNLAPQLWTATISVALVAAIFLLARFFEIRGQGLKWLIGLTLLSGPACEALRIGQIAPFLLLAFVGFLHFARANKIAAAALMLALFVLKPQQMFPLAIFLIGARKFKLLAGAAGIVIALTLISLPFFGIDGYLQYINVVTDKANLLAMRPDFNPTVRGQFLRFFGLQSHLPTIAGIVCLLVFTIFAFLLGRKYKDDPRWLIAAAAGVMPLGLATSMHCHDYDLLLLIPAIVAFARKEFALNKFTGFTLLIAVVLFLEPFYAQVHYQYLAEGALINVQFIVFLVAAIACAISVWKDSVIELPASEA